jgi:CRISPR-associated endonuclease/helicase Cas3
MIEDDVLIGHSREDGAIQPLEDHLRGVARIAAEFGRRFSAAGWAAAAGILHDDGKALPEFQTRIRKLMEDKPAARVDHSSPGARYVADNISHPPGAGKLLSYCIAGHHAGLPDGRSGDDESSLSRRLSRAKSGPGILRSELPTIEIPPFLTSKPDNQRVGFQAAFFTRMIFSALVDADFLDTEAFVDPERGEKRRPYRSLTDLRTELDRFLHQLGATASETEINLRRAEILSQARRAAIEPPGLRSLTVPTGGGKTLSSLAFAMDHAVTYGMERVIYVIPYTSIIEQTADVFRRIFGDHAVLEHHSNVIRDHDHDDEEREERRRLAAENWDAPIIVTTNVQFFESFFGNRTSKVRRLHNVANSVVVLDEAQMLPVPFLKPTLEVIKELALTYHSTVVLCTATQPALQDNESFAGGLTDVREIVEAPQVLESAFRRVEAQQLGDIPDDDLALRLAQEPQVLCIVNTRGHARNLYQKLGTLIGDAYHLSALMCPMHRRAVLKEIRDQLQQGLPCRVVSTQLVEAGVDVDFPVVYRAVTGIDSIVQAAGRCNREGRLQCGRLYVFRPDGGLPPGHFRQNAQVADLVLRNHPDVMSSEAVREYFRELYWTKDQGQGLDEERILQLFRDGTTTGDFPFKTIARKYRLIADDQVSIIVPYDTHAARECERLRHTRYPGAILRGLQPYTVGLRPRAVTALIRNFYVEEIQEDVFVMTEFGMQNAYEQKIGLNPTEPDFYRPENLIT